MNLFRKLLFWKWTDDEVFANEQKRLRRSRFFIAIMAVLAIIGVGLFYSFLFVLMDTAKMAGEPTDIDLQPAMVGIGFLLGVAAMSLIGAPAAIIGMWIHQARISKSKLLLKLRDRVRELEARPANHD